MLPLNLHRGTTLNDRLTQDRLYILHHHLARRPANQIDPNHNHATVGVGKGDQGFSQYLDVSIG